MIVCPWFFFLGKSKRKLLEPFTDTHTQPNPTEKKKGFAEMNYVCQMCIKLAYITIYFGLHLQYIIHTCDVLLFLLLLVLSLECVRAYPPYLLC